jgi:hypothetical protein
MTYFLIEDFALCTDRWPNMKPVVVKKKKTKKNSAYLSYSFFNEVVATSKPASL